ncbi:heterokaryon incompatibility protein-domain-containing protein [Lophiotrema nucula]|uniref:Heterokaryon incompatibility protein-domain-containing protein n=1 Tax=Lophiotrema nucula TaxID=690887 RepID=A0A6A5ZWJ6_9PLEO|nr:heterokaryon incompatibility protein-domain-containing protein [Lophiotrema nucula]
MARLWPTGIFCMADPQEYWPHRLLHIPSMTSVVRQGSDTYLVDNCRQLIRKPPYSVLSYTWGRYEKRPRKPEHRRLKVHGIDWDIPPIDETHFTVEDFESVIEVLRCRHEFAWIDIACIHQEDNLLKLQEIGQQGKIFQRAESAFIWLCRTTTRSLDHHSKSLKSVSDLFLEEVDYNFFEGPQSVLEAKKRVSEARYRSQEYENQVAQTLDTAIAAITELTKDPYFTSLWTLQEAMYHQSALTLSSDGSLVIPHPLGFGNLQAACPRKDSTVIQQRIQSIMALMSGVGYDPSAAKISNPHQSRAAAQHRRASLDQDRIFATMSLYGLTTRAAKDSSLKDPYLYSLDELEYAFAATLNSVSPSLGQVFTHVTAPEIGQTWKITADAKIADDHQIWTTNWRRWKTHCNIKATEVGHASFSGEIKKHSWLRSSRNTELVL